MKYPLIKQSLPALLGEDFYFPHEIIGQAFRASDFPDLKVSSFSTSDRVNLAYWEAGEGQPLIFIPGWSANGAMYFHLMHILSKHYHVYVLDVRNQGFSEKTASGNRISRYAMDVKEFAEHLGLPEAHYCGWSMGASVMWAYIDLFGTQGIRTLSIIDQAPSVYCHADWTEQQRLDAGAFTTSPERMIDSYVNMTPTNQLVSRTRYGTRLSLFSQCNQLGPGGHKRRHGIHRIGAFRPCHQRLARRHPNQDRRAHRDIHRGIQ
ncbi:AB hydrolase superfamily protein YdjP [Pseudomonas fluorescens]|uniref:AB hydrolase superfamily protein YdjP n=1 Tax=Pseudomonas fluorescens TaxID=294 RepID=A0A125QF46_PSEFL|nr:AB hydrolase superfamily protein YdjP [Pseudomonas fluorescens]